jgi:hypothetical protein
MSSEVFVNSSLFLYVITAKSIAIVALHQGFANWMHEQKLTPDWDQLMVAECSGPCL